MSDIRTRTVLWVINIVRYSKHNHPLSSVIYVKFESVSWYQIICMLSYYGPQRLYQRCKLCRCLLTPLVLNSFRKCFHSQQSFVRNAVKQYSRKFQLLSRWSNALLPVTNINKHWGVCSRTLKTETNKCIKLGNIIVDKFKF